MIIYEYVRKKQINVRVSDSGPRQFKTSWASKNKNAVIRKYKSKESAIYQLLVNVIMCVMKATGTASFSY